MKHSTSRLLALLLTLCLLVGLVPAAVFAQSEQPSGSRQIQAEEVENFSQPEWENTGSLSADRPAPTYSDDDMVIVIVELEAPSVLEQYNTVSTYSVSNQSAGEALASFMATQDAQDAAEELRTAQEPVISAIRAMANPIATISTQDDEDDLVLWRWTKAFNGLAVKIPYGMLDEIRSLEGVRNAHVQQTYELPEVMPGTGDAGYSYNLVNLQKAWDEGYTGKGMVVAVLDTGLDLDYASYSVDAPGSELGYENVTRIRHTHEAFREDSFKSDNYKDFIRYNQGAMMDTVDRLGTQLNAARLRSAGIAAVYKNSKVPFAFDYAGTVDPETLEVLDGDFNVYPKQEGDEHGTHVSGTILGYAKTPDGGVKFSGVAPDAQLLMMKVFDDEGGMAAESIMLNALEDAMLLGADVVNMSLGSNNGFAFDDSLQHLVCEELKEAGIIMMTSSGNSQYSAYNNLFGGYNLAEDPDVSMVSSPAVYASNLAVASSNSVVTVVPYLKWTDGSQTYDAIYVDNHPNLLFRTTLTEDYIQEMGQDHGLELILVDGEGTWQDYYDAGFRNYYGYGEKGKTGIALVKRGGLSFEEKVNNAYSFRWSNYEGGKMVTGGVLGVIIYDSDPSSEEMIYMSGVENTTMPSCFVSGKAGAAMEAAARQGSAWLSEVERTDRLEGMPSGGGMSSFSSWGTGPSLELKPDITAPGGNIWSSVFDRSYDIDNTPGDHYDYNGDYAMMSGTSMASPHMSGIASLVQQYIKEDLRTVSRDQRDEIASALLVSTAQPVLQSDGETYASPRHQGAGLVNVGAAVTSPAYISVEGQTVGKLELKDDPNWTGSFPFSFNINSLNDSAAYSVKLVLQRPGTKVEDGYTLTLTDDVTIRTEDLGTYTVPAGGTTTVSGTISLTPDEIAELKALFPNGTFLEGFIILTSSTAPQLGLPFLGFVGDWTAAPIFDRASWAGATAQLVEDHWVYDVEEDYSWGISVASYYTGADFIDLGFNPWAAGGIEEYHPGNFTIAPGTGIIQDVNNLVLYQLRDAKLLVIQVRDAETNDLYFMTYGTEIPRTSTETDVAIPYLAQKLLTWGGTDLDGNPLPNGTECIYSVLAFGDGDYPMGVDELGPYTDYSQIDLDDPDTWPTFNGHKMDMTGDVFSFPVRIDTEAPKLVNSAVSCYTQDGKTFLSGTVTDNGALAAVMVYPQVVRTYNMERNPYADPSYAETSIDRSSPFLAQVIWDEALGEYTFQVDVSNYEHVESHPGENETYNFTFTGNVFIVAGDYGGNERTYAAPVNASKGITLVPTSAQLFLDGEEAESGFTLEVVYNSDEEPKPPLTFVSSDPAVATVDEYGHIQAVGLGQAVITVSNGVDSAVCVVAVREKQTQVIDFRLSIDHFETIRPDGAIIVKVMDLEPADVDIKEINWEVFEDDPDLYSGLVDVSKYGGDGLTGSIQLLYDTNEELPIPGSTGTLRVTINGVAREMTFKWADLYQSAEEDGLISDTSYTGEQTIYVAEGEAAQLIAKYRANTHDFLPVALYTAKGSIESYGSNNNPTEPAEGLKLYGPDFTSTGAPWDGQLVAEPGYVLPETIRVFTRYGDGGESEMIDYGYSHPFTYDSETGEIHVAYSPYGSDSTLVIRADGVSQPGAPGGVMGGQTWTRPDGLYGPFDWTWVSGVEGTLETFENELIGGYTIKNGARFTANGPGVSYLRATSKDGKYTLDFAVVTEPKTASTISVAPTTAAGTALNGHELTMDVGASETANIVLSPMPTEEVDQELIWTSFDPDVATVDANGVITAVGPGYAYIRVLLANRDADGEPIETYIIVHVLGDVPTPPGPDEPVNPPVNPPVIPPVDSGYEITDGNGNNWNGTGDSGLTFQANGPASGLMGIYVDGKLVPPGSYTVNPDGSVTLSPAYLATLTSGAHTITIQYANGSATGTFTVRSTGATHDSANDTPKTGDTALPALWAAALVFSSALGMAILVPGAKKYLKK